MSMLANRENLTKDGSIIVGCVHVARAPSSDNILEHLAKKKLNDGGRTEWSQNNVDPDVQKKVGKGKHTMKKENQKPDPPGIVIDRSGNTYHIGKQIGRGGYSRCYMASNKKGQVFAAKTISLTSLSKSSIYNIIREAHIHERMHHPFIVEFFQILQGEGNIIMLLDYCQNRTLNDLISRIGRLQEADACKMLAPIFCAVDYLHTQLIHHGDLKLSNIFLDHNMVPRVGDFGFARQLKHPDQTRQNMCGTPAYMAPEIVRKPCNFGLPADIWALGVIAYALIQGITPFDAKSVDSVYERIRKNDLKFPQTSQIVSAAAIEAISAMLRTNPSERPISKHLVENTWVKCYEKLIYLKPSHHSFKTSRYKITEVGVKGDSKPKFSQMCKIAYMNTAFAKKVRNFRRLLDETSPQKNKNKLVK